MGHLTPIPVRFDEPERAMLEELRAETGLRSVADVLRQALRTFHASRARSRRRARSTRMDAR
ncbi:MAG: ribbon-helix-helix protein, CopG family [Myxococcales bacterium]|nr:ribbon-helix-helix protein, CopG family [Myxococcales bacterium]